MTGIPQTTIIHVYTVYIYIYIYIYIYNTKSVGWWSGAWFETEVISKNIFFIKELIKESCKHVSQFPQKYWAEQLFSMLIVIRNVNWAPNQHIRMISKRSCDTEDWSNVKFSFAIMGINYISTFIQTKYRYFKLWYFTIFPFLKYLW